MSSKKDKRSSFRNPFSPSSSTSHSTTATKERDNFKNEFLTSASAANRRITVTLPGSQDYLPVIPKTTHNLNVSPPKPSSLNQPPLNSSSPLPFLPSFPTNTKSPSSNQSLPSSPTPITKPVSSSPTAIKSSLGSPSASTSTPSSVGTSYKVKSMIPDDILDSKPKNDGKGNIIPPTYKPKSLVSDDSISKSRTPTTKPFSSSDSAQKRNSSPPISTSAYPQTPSTAPNAILPNRGPMSQQASTNPPPQPPKHQYQHQLLSQPHEALVTQQPPIPSYDRQSGASSPDSTASSFYGDPSADYPTRSSTVISTASSFYPNNNNNTPTRSTTTRTSTWDSPYTEYKPLAKPPVNLLARRRKPAPPLPPLPGTTTAPPISPPPSNTIILSTQSSPPPASLAPPVPVKSILAEPLVTTTTSETFKTDKSVSENGPLSVKPENKSIDSELDFSPAKKYTPLQRSVPISRELPPKPASLSSSDDEVQDKSLDEHLKVSTTNDSAEFKRDLLLTIDTEIEQLTQVRSGNSSANLTNDSETSFGNLSNAESVNHYTRLFPKEKSTTPLALSRANANDNNAYFDLGRDSGTVSQGKPHNDLDHEEEEQLENENDTSGEHELNFSFQKPGAEEKEAPEMDSVSIEKERASETNEEIDQEDNNDNDYAHEEQFNENNTLLKSSPSFTDLHKVLADDPAKSTKFSKPSMSNALVVGEKSSLHSSLASSDDDVFFDIEEAPLSTTVPHSSNDEYDTDVKEEPDTAIDGPHPRRASTNHYEPTTEYIRDPFKEDTPDEIIDQAKQEPDYHGEVVESPDNSLYPTTSSLNDDDDDTYEERRIGKNLIVQNPEWFYSEDEANTNFEGTPVAVNNLLGSPFGPNSDSDNETNKRHHALGVTNNVGNYDDDENDHDYDGANPGTQSWLGTPTGPVFEPSTPNPSTPASNNRNGGGLVINTEARGSGLKNDDFGTTGRTFKVTNDISDSDKDDNNDEEDDEDDEILFTARSPYYTHFDIDDGQPKHKMKIVNGSIDDLNSTVDMNDGSPRPNGGRTRQLSMSNADADDDGTNDANNLSTVVPPVSITGQRSTSPVTTPFSYDRRETPTVAPLSHSTVISAATASTLASGGIQKSQSLARRPPPDFPSVGRGARGLSFSTAKPELFDSSKVTSLSDDLLLTNSNNSRSLSPAIAIATTQQAQKKELINDTKITSPSTSTATTLVSKTDDSKTKTTVTSSSGIAQQDVLNGKGKGSAYIDKIRTKGKGSYTPQLPPSGRLPIAIRSKRAPAISHSRTASSQSANATMASYQTSLKHGNLKPRTRMLASEIDANELPDSTLSHSIGKTKIPIDPDAEILAITEQLKMLTGNKSYNIGVSDEAANASAVEGSGGLSRYSSVRSARGVAAGEPKFKLYIANPDDESD